MTGKWAQGAKGKSDLLIPANGTRDTPRTDHNVGAPRLTAREGRGGTYLDAAKQEGLSRRT